MLLACKMHFSHHVALSETECSSLYSVQCRERSSVNPAFLPLQTPYPDFSALPSHLNPPDTHAGPSGMPDKCSHASAPSTSSTPGTWHIHNPSTYQSHPESESQSNGWNLSLSPLQCQDIGLWEPEQTAPLETKKQVLRRASFF